MNIESVKYPVNEDGTIVTDSALIVVADGVTMSVPVDENNIDYVEVMKQVNNGDITIANAE